MNKYEREREREKEREFVEKRMRERIFILELIINLISKTGN
jgi:hypothetical protein